MKTRSALIPSLLFGSLAWLGLAAIAAAPNEVQKVTPERLLQRRSLSELEFSADQSYLAFTVTEPVSGSEQNRDIWVFDVKRGLARRFTTSEKVDRHPRWAPKESRLAFLSPRSGTAQIHLIRADGGEAEVLTKSETDVQSFEWSPSGKQIAFMAEEAKSEAEKERDKKKDDAIVVDAGDRLARLWVLDIDSGKVSEMTAGGWRIDEFAWLAEKRLLVSATEDTQPELLTNRLYTIEIPSGTMAELARPANPFGALNVSPDRSRVAFVGARGEGPVGFDLFLVDVDSGLTRNLTSESIGRAIEDYQWRTNETLLALIPEGFRDGFYDVTVDGRAQRRSDFDIDPSGSIAVGPDLLAFVGQSSTRLPEIWLVGGEGTASAVTQLNEDWSNVALVAPEVFQYPATDGLEIEAALYLPADRVDGARLPLIVQVHGGPTGRYSDRFNDWAQLLAANGFAVLCPNIRGSVGYGHDFMASNRRDWGGADFQDVMAGIDYLIHKGIADPDRLGIAGWSYGGYMAAWAVTQTDRFKASVSGAPMTDLEFEYGTETASINAYDTWFLGTPYENQQLFVERSPMTHIRAAKTPTLLLCGDNDVIDPPGQCQQFYRGLRRLGVEATYVRYPREGHGIREEMHQLDLLNRLVAWFRERL